MPHQELTIDEVIGRSQQGKTEPFICRASDGHIYYVKGAGAGRRSLICEWVAGNIASNFGLPIAQYRIADVPEELVQYSSRSDIADLGTGLVFASRALSNVQELTRITQQLVPKQTARDVLIFDWWLKNEDRHLTESGGNPNLLWDVANEKLAVIDHNLAFDSSFNCSSFLESHVFASHWNSAYSDHLVRENYRAKFAAALAELPAIRASIPETWWWIDEGVPASIAWNTIHSCLERGLHDHFWEIS